MKNGKAAKLSVAESAKEIAEAIPELVATQKVASRAAGSAGMVPGSEEGFFLSEVSGFHFNRRSR